MVAAWAEDRDFTGFSHSWWFRTLVVALAALIIGAEIRQFRRNRQQKRAAGAQAGPNNARAELKFHSILALPEIACSVCCNREGIDNACPIYRKLG